MIIQIDDKLISSDLLEESFVCDLNACKGACCVEGDSGAPLLTEELENLEANFDSIKDFLREDGLKAIEKQGLYIKDEDDEWVTPLKDGQECAYTLFDEKGVAQCGIEGAWKAGKSNFQKPVSCHLYPVRVKRYEEITALNYEQWNICSPACSLGKELKVPVFRFVKDALVRRFGKDFYSSLESTSIEWNKVNH